MTIATEVKAVSLDQNVDRINFANTASSYAFKQAVNIINVYDATGITLIVHAPVQGDSNGTLLGFSDGTASVILSSGVMTLGRSTVSTATPSALVPTLTAP